MKKGEAAAAESFLREREARYVGACSRFINRDEGGDRAWVLSGGDSKISAFVMLSKRALLPVFAGRQEIPDPSLLCGFFLSKNVNSVLGLKREVELLEGFLKKSGKAAYDSIDYDLMALDRMPKAAIFSKGPRGLVFRKPDLKDLTALSVLQAEYEKEEVLPKGAVFSPEASRQNLARLLEKTEILAAELDGLLVGKVNVNAVSYTQVQIGGVYVRPDFRGQGVGSRLVAEFVGNLFRAGSPPLAVSLFVKKSNPAARALYAGMGFETKADFRISYYK